jgi:hypothetical protein
VRLLSPWIVVKLRQPERRVGEEQDVVAAIHQVVGRIEPLAIKAIGQHRGEAVLFNAHHATVTVLASHIFAQASASVAASAPWQFRAHTAQTSEHVKHNSTHFANPLVSVMAAVRALPMEMFGLAVNVPSRRRK